MRSFKSRVARAEFVFEEDSVAGLGPETTRLHCFVGIRSRPDAKHKQASIKVRLKDAKFNRKDGTAVISVSDDPEQIEGNLEIPSKVFNELKIWISLNKEFLKEYWVSEDTRTDIVMKKLKKVPKDST